MYVYVYACVQSCLVYLVTKGVSQRNEKLARHLYYVVFKMVPTQNLHIYCIYIYVYIYILIILSDP